MKRLLEVKNLRTEFHIDGKRIHSVAGVSYYINEGEIVSFVGESGSGKSVTQMSGLQLVPTPPGKITGGEVLYKGINLLDLHPESEELRSIRGGEIGFIFQEPMTSLNPVLTIGEQIIESVMLHLKLSKADARKQAIETLKKVGIPDAEARIDDYPHQFSGGMRQRVMIAMALAVKPKIIIADEVTTALDVTTQAQILELMKEIVKSTNTSLLIITHNLGIVARYAERIYVMYAGTVVETGTTEELFNNPRHPYTIGLMNAIPRLDDPKERKLTPIEGLPPNLINKPEQCPFVPRCRYRTERCVNAAMPELRHYRGEHYVACYHQMSKSDYLLTENKRDAKATYVEDRVNKKPLADNEEQQEGQPILEIRNLKVYFPVKRGLMQRKVGEVKAVDGISFQLNKGETLGLVGESGCGKTTVARTVMRLYKPTSGQILFNNQDISSLSNRNLRPIRKHISMIFQDPFGSLNPRQSAGSIVGEPLMIHKLVSSRSEYESKVDQLFHMVGLNPELKHRVPHEFSGGQRQRIGIARALASNPSLIVCDEAISALDVSIQAQIVNLLENLKEELGLSYLFIAHDLSVVRHISDRVAVMYLGRIVEMGDWKSLYENPLHPYTKALLEAVPIPDPDIEAQRETIILPGEPPSPLNRPSGCSFYNRCPIATETCKEHDPELKAVALDHHVACLNSEA